MEIIKREKVLSRGKFSLDVIIPAWWAKGNNIFAGSEVMITATPNRIVIEPLNLLEEQ